MSDNKLVCQGSSPLTPWFCYGSETDCEGAQNGLADARVCSGVSTQETTLTKTEEGKVFGDRVELWNNP
jgi:hypothetical protein